MTVHSQSYCAEFRAVVSSFAVVRLMCAWRKADRKTITDNDNDTLFTT